MSDYKLSQDTLGFPFPRDDTEIQTAWSAAERRSHSPTPLLPQTRQPREARSFHSSHTHLTLALAQRASSSEHGAGRQAAPGRRGQGALGQKDPGQSAEGESRGTGTAGHRAGAGASGRRQQQERWGEDQARTEGVHGELVWPRRQRVNYR